MMEQGRLAAPKAGPEGFGKGLSGNYVPEKIIFE